MWSPEVNEMIVKGIGETLYMTVFSTAIGYLFGLPLGVCLAVTDIKRGLEKNGKNVQSIGKTLHKNYEKNTKQRFLRIPLEINI